MINKLKVFYSGWGEHWHWGNLWLMDHRINNIVFEYTSTARKKGLELSPLNMPLSRNTYDNFPAYQDHLPGVLSDCLPDGWGRLIMDRLFRRLDIPLDSINSLDRLAYIGNNAMGAFVFEPEHNFNSTQIQDLSLTTLAAESQKIINDKETDLLNQLVLLGGSPHGARPKVLIYRSQSDNINSNFPFKNAEPWIVKFPAQNESAETCAIEYVYSHCARESGILMQDTEYFDLGKGLAAVGSKRFDRLNGMRIPMHTLAGYLHDNFRIPACDYDTLIRATGHITKNNQAEIRNAFNLAVFNVVFNNRDDHTKNFSFVLNKRNQWQLSPAYDLTFNEGPNGYHQMSVMGQALNITKLDLVKLGKVAGLSKQDVLLSIQKTVDVANRFSEISERLLPGLISKNTLNHIQNTLNKRINSVK